MEVLAVVAVFWLLLLGVYYAWPFVFDRVSLRRVRLPREGKARPPRLDAPRSRIVSTSYLQDDLALAQRFQKQVEEAKAALEHPPARRGPVVSETVPSTFADQPLPPRPSRPTTTAVTAAARPIATATPRVHPTVESQPVTVATRLAAATAVDQEIDLLRAQVERLRTELAALAHGNLGSRFERPRLRRYGPGVYTQLPRPLRQRVAEARSRRLAAGSHT